MKGLVVALLLVATACSSGPSTGVAAEPSPSPTPAPTETPRAISFPGPDRSAPYKPGVLAREIRVTEHKLHRAIAVWQDAGGRRRSAEGHTVALGALWQQKLTRRLVARSRILDQVLGALSASLRHVVSARVRAGAGLRALTSPVTGHPDFRITPPTPYRELERFYRAGDDRYAVPAAILASVNFVETKFGRFMGPSSAGAKGPMQFMPSTWDAYGNGGDIWDPHDSIIAAARYLHAMGAPGDMDRALYAYNNSEAYVRAILIYGRQIANRPDAFYEFYFWQVFVRTKHGDVQLTGPGHDHL